MKLIYRELLDYCTEVIEDFALRLNAALAQTSCCRCSLQHCDYNLYSEIESAISDYCTDNNLDSLSIDIETLIYS